MMLLKLTRELALAAGQDARTRRMRKTGRSKWNRADFNEAAKVLTKLMASAREVTK